MLLIGSDKRAKSAVDASTPAHSDTMLLVRLDPNQPETTMLSIPRDLKVTIHPDHGRPMVAEDQRGVHDRRRQAHDQDDQAGPRGPDQPRRRRQLRRLQGARQLPRLRLRPGRSSLLPLEHRARRRLRPTTRSTSSPATRSCAVTTPCTTSATATPTPTSYAARASRTSCARSRIRSAPPGWSPGCIRSSGCSASTRAPTSARPTTC